MSVGKAPLGALLFAVILRALRPAVSPLPVRRNGGELSQRIK